MDSKSQFEIKTISRKNVDVKSMPKLQEIAVYIRKKVTGGIRGAKSGHMEQKLIRAIF